MTLDELNKLPEEDFTAALAGIFEHSPWIAQAAAGARPFADVASLHQAMVAALAQAPEERKLELLQLHPELAGKLARTGGLTEASTEEQASAGLDRLEPEEIAQFDIANARYREKFGFPFIIAVKAQRDRRAILEALAIRVGHSRDEEIETALGEVALIARFRLDALLPQIRLTLHVLDTTLGKPAAGIGFSLYREGVLVREGRTNADGRAEEGPMMVEPGTYELVYKVADYHESEFYDRIPIRFRISAEGGNYHVPLILSRFGYSTYRGS